MPGDLHSHTTFSDGSTPADKLPFLAACAGMTHLAISDHDSIRSVRYAYAHPVQNGVPLLPATELTAYDYERAHRVHLLCYWPDDCAALADFSAMMLGSMTDADMQLVPVTDLRAWYISAYLDDTAPESGEIVFQHDASQESETFDFWFITVQIRLNDAGEIAYMEYVYVPWA